ncbi:MAG: ABC transporter substrate-binding protein [Clostridiales Family XIII bacterium]|nr:ABC transporter substrate-binding protein [Clostridiales Family XIII bacterium]
MRHTRKNCGIAILILVMLLGSFTALTACRSARGDEVFRGQRTVIDHAGREVTIPTANKLERIYYTSALAQVFVFSLAPELQGGTGIQFTKEELKYLPPETTDLLYMGSLSGGGEIDREMLMAQDIQLIFSISGVGLTGSNISDAESLQKATGIPVVLVDGSFDKIAEAYRFIGDIMGREERAEKIASYLEGIYDEVTEAMSHVDESKRVSLYYAEGPFGLATEPNISQHALTFEIAKAKNVAAVEEIPDLGMTTVSLESVLAWDPDVIIAWDSVIRGGADEIIRTNPNWENIKAVKTGRVYTMPNAPFAWCDRPPGVNRFIGIQWAANMLYPDLYDIDMVERVKEFYSIMYWVEISDEDALELLGNSYPPYRKQ